MWSWLEKLIDYRHEIRMQKMTCQSCEILKSVISQQNEQISSLVSQLNYKSQPTEPSRPEVPLKPINPALASWKVQRAALEAESRVKQKTIRELEQSIGIKDSESA